MAMRPYNVLENSCLQIKMTEKTEAILKKCIFAA